MQELLFFYGLECTHCIRMEKLVDKLSALGFSVKKVEVWHNSENNKLLEKLDKECAEKEKARGEEGEPCGGVPFFFNQSSGKSICGEVSYEELESWANGSK